MHNDDNRLLRLYSTSPVKALSTLLNDLTLSENLSATCTLAIKGTTQAGPDVVSGHITNRLTDSVMQLEKLVKSLQEGEKNGD